MASVKIAGALVDTDDPCALYQALYAAKIKLLAGEEIEETEIRSPVTQQRLKIARELAATGRRAGRRIYIMDEPTTGLAGAEVRKLMDVLHRLVEAGHTVIVIEHNMDVIRGADWVIDMGPEAGAGGGRLVAAGRPADIERIDASHTGRYLRR